MTSSLKEKIPLRVDSSFKQEVLKMPGGNTLKICFQCGSCTASCPVARFSEVFRPNRLIHMARLGLKEMVLSEDTIWLCAACYTCTERCPQGVEVKELMRVFKNLAVKEGKIPKFYKEAGANLLQSGLAYRIPESRIRRRTSIGLPPLSKTNTDALKKLAKVTGFSDLLKGGERD